MAVNYTKIGERIQQARKMKNLTITELSELVHFTPKSIAYAESGQATINLEFLLPLCTTLDISPNELLEGEYHCSEAPSFRQQFTDAQLQEIFDAINADADDEPSSSTVIKDTETVIEEFKEIVRKYHLDNKNRPRSVPQKRNVHW